MQTALSKLRANHNPIFEVEPMAAWDSITLCTRTTIEAKIGKLDLFLQLPEPEKDEAITNALRDAKTMIRNKLMTSLPEIFVSTVGEYTSLSFGDWVTQRGYTYADLDGLLDMLANPGELEEAAIYGSIYSLVKRMMIQFRASYNVDSALFTDQRDFYKKEFECSLQEAVRRLQFDLSQDGIIQDFERPRTHTNLFRS